MEFIWYLSLRLGVALWRCGIAAGDAILAHMVALESAIQVLVGYVGRDLSGGSSGNGDDRGSVPTTPSPVRVTENDRGITRDGGLDYADIQPFVVATNRVWRIRSRSPGKP